MKHAFVALLCAAGLFAQEGVIVNATIGPAPTAHQKLIYYDGSNRAEYVCVARSNQPERVLTVASISKANPAVVTVTGHGFGDYATFGATIKPVIKITGMSGNWAGINGVWVGTVTAANTFTIPVNTSAYSGTADTTARVTTTSPRTSDAVWSINRFFYDSSGNFVASAWAANPGGASATDAKAGQTSMSFACGSRTSYAYQ